VHISELVKSAHKNAKEKGFWDEELSIIGKMYVSYNFSDKEIEVVKNAFRAQKLMLIVSELSEGLEGLRHGDWSNFKEELADVAIRLGDLSGGLSIDLETEIAAKMDKNSKRPYKHGKEF
jgi:NTP pyrophosphatase (non-canonical NTP hydrolase)